MQTPLFDFTSSDEYAGFRLEKLEIYNWGTFDKKVWSLQPEGENCLLTGEIGSGKSTIVDAITTLFVPAQKAAFNKAAGAGKKERSLRSYVLGYYRNERSEFGPSSTPVALRDQKSYSVILGVFFNKGYNQRITLAQVFWCKDKQGQPDRYYIVAKQPLSIQQDFSNFGSDFSELKKRLRKKEGVELFETFPPYSAEFMRQFGIKHKQALELFHQTVSMKSVGNLTEFVRQHMLEAFDVELGISALIDHYDDLQRAYDAVLKAKEQIRQLMPLVENYQQYLEFSTDKEDLQRCEKALPSYFAGVKAKLLEKRLEDLSEKIENLEAEYSELGRQEKESRIGQEELKKTIAENGGNRLSELNREREGVLSTKKSKQEKAERYQRLVKQLGLSQLETREVFQANIRRLQSLTEEVRDASYQLRETLTQKSIELAQKRKEYGELCDERDSLQDRQSNIPFKLISLREKMCEQLGLAASELPFVGELLQVRAEDDDWQGAVERVLHNFGLSLLVPDKHYRRVSDYVDATHLRGRVVYYKVDVDTLHALPSLDVDSLVRKIEIKPDSGYYGWLEHELVTRFNYICCRETARFRREKQAITLAGQIKSGGRRHEKDDRHHLGDRKRYILGWNNREKIAVITEQLTVFEKDIQDLGGALAGLEQKSRDNDENIKVLGQLEEFTDYAQQDWQSDVKKADELAREMEKLQASSNILKSLNNELEKLNTKLDSLGQRREETLVGKSRFELEAEQAQIQYRHCCRDIEQIVEAERDELFEYFDSIVDEVLGQEPENLDSCSVGEQKLRSWFTEQIVALDGRLGKLAEKIASAMYAYCSDFEVETREVDATLSSGPEYVKMLEELQGDDLPRYEQSFKESLNLNTIREIVQFQANLEKQNRIIKERIEQINHSLAGIEFNQGRYIELESAGNIDREIREFQRQLRVCGTDSIAGVDGEQYAENKFHEVRRLIERFRGRPEAIDIDRKWAKKVTDVRNWYTFAASERYLEDGSEYEHYTDTGGKSGGQKEKLAYTVLAASLVYQFGIERGTIKSRSFRFVVIDEAFGRGSDESTRYALQLFRELNLQLLIVTPLQKIHIIEPYVSSVGFIHNAGGFESQVKSLTIEQFQLERAKREGVNIEYLE